MAAVTRFSDLVFFSLDVEAAGLQGEPFAAGYVLIPYEGKEIEQGYFSCPFDKAKGSEPRRKWVKENVVPNLPKGTNCQTPEEVCKKVYAIWLELKEKYKNRLIAIADWGYPVETNFFSRTVSYDEQKRVMASDDAQFSGPAPLHEVATALAMAGINEDDYPRRPDELPKHHPTNDARYSARLFLTAFKKAQQIGAKL